jgi:SPP1 gp7 family putative phage head morphogenesis protein
MAELAPLLKRRTDAQTRTDGAGSIIEALTQRIQLGLASRVRAAFDPMARKVEENAWRAVGVTQEGTGVKTAIDAAREASIRLVEKAHRVYATDVRAVMEDPSTFGKRVEDIRDDLIERGNVSESRAELIARDQTLKLNGAITQARQEDAGVEEYEWSTSGDERVRETHQANEGKRFRWDSPPETGHPGEDYQCRCVAIAVLPE